MIELAIEFTVGACFLVMGLSWLFHQKDWLVWMDKVQAQGRQASLSYGMLNILIGTFIISHHWVWDGPACLTTIIGLMAAAKGVVYLLCPGWLPAKIRYFKDHCNYCSQAAILFLVVFSVVILYWWAVQIGALPNDNWPASLLTQNRY